MKLCTYMKRKKIIIAGSLDIGRAFSLHLEYIKPCSHIFPECNYIFNRDKAISDFLAHSKLKLENLNDKQYNHLVKIIKSQVNCYVCLTSIDEWKVTPDEAILPPLFILHAMWCTLLCFKQLAVLPVELVHIIVKFIWIT
jgi:hypothetical protein